MYRFPIAPSVTNTSEPERGRETSVKGPELMFIQQTLFVLMKGFIRTHEHGVAYQGELVHLNILTGRRAAISDNCGGRKFGISHSELRLHISGGSILCNQGFRMFCRLMRLQSQINE